MHWTEEALRKSGYESREAFQKAMGLELSGQWDLPTCRLLWPWISGYACHRVQPGQTLYQIAQQWNSQVRWLLTANRLKDGRPPYAGQLLQIPLAGLVTGGALPFCSQLEQIWLDGLQARYPWLTASVLTKSAGGRPLLYLRMGTGRRQVLVTGAHHGNEGITGLLLWRLLERYCEAVRDGGSLFGFSAAALLQRTTLHMVPTVNPDGVDLAAGEIRPNTEAYRQASVLAKNQPQVPFPTGWKANLNGVDLNLNYPADWNAVAARKPKTPGPRDYPGTAPLDQPETEAIRQLVLRICPDALAAWHTQGGEIYAADEAGCIPDQDLAKRMASVSGYALKQVPPQSRGGGLRDWYLAETGRPAFTIEAGRGENPLPQEMLQQLEEENLPILALLLAG